MKDIFNRLGGSSIFSTLDLKAGYHQIPLVESSKEKTAFITDACNYSIGDILIQTDDSGVEKIIQYVSKTLNSAQLRWPVIEKKAFAVIYTLRKLCTYLYGAKFIVYTDHKPIISLFTKKMKNTKIQRWAIELEEFDCEIRYKKRSENQRADFMSRIRNEIHSGNRGI